ncbi:glutamine--fructose-6-phosphate transaminase (isomerizing) [Synechococcus sp. CS-205]|uniref:glutamine--fructose-6-phosphate transaminase (isomerizing) n=1 Tax=Synechococcus sp. CS-205 TaxID=2847984 RepID=UPI00223AE3F9|nr:glutamine--fructose-6-phosphate transaminase (isomerizing) [Synechococcus sp. CS-205]MCT0249174.1 glutamine--fructose-6-phosphate transaminase (isomerizing) [Synechococcus sp. CS-205]
MCGIVAVIGSREAAPLLLEGLRQLEYRGYDSAGIATVQAPGAGSGMSSGHLTCLRAEGKLINLTARYDALGALGHCGIGHTRWATHGKPEERNAHPHLDGSGSLAVVQNGIIENHRPLREALQSEGVQFRSDTDTEVIPHLIARRLRELRQAGAEASPQLLLQAVQEVLPQLHGAYALAVIWAEIPGAVVVARRQAPLVIGLGEGEFLCASDTPALAGFTRTILPLEDGETALLTPLGIELYGAQGERVQRSPSLLQGTEHVADKRSFRHFMHKEIHEQPETAALWVARHLPTQSIGAPGTPSLVALPLQDQLFEGVERIQILACGTSRHAALVGAYLLEQLAGLPTAVHYASEFRYAPPPLVPHTLTIGVTQSGETADTLAALQMEQQRRELIADPAFAPRLLGITNRQESSLGRLVPHLLDIGAGIEVGVAATKTFLGQLLAFYGLALSFAERRSSRSPAQLLELVAGLRALPAQLQTLLEEQDLLCAELAHQFADTQDVIFLGRGINVPIALEGALKLKEISYIHAEGYPAGEMKHGPIALLDARVPVVSIAVPGSVFDKVLSNAQEAKARDARLIGVAPRGPDTEIFDVLLPVPEVDELLSPLLTVIPMQLLSYHIAAHRGLDVDQPRNLAKSVTVE